MMSNAKAGKSLPDFEYDVAFSFQAQDENLATQLNDLLNDRFKTFLYSKKQEMLAGTDGEKKFNEVFSTNSRTVCVLYRSGWGESTWTRIEETAIKNRAFDDGYDFSTFIPIEQPPTVPKWLPKTQLWFGLNRFGISGAAAVLEAKIQQAGGTASEESVADRAARLKRFEIFRASKLAFEKSEQGVWAAKKDYEALLSQMGESEKILFEANIAFKKFSYPSAPANIFAIGQVFLRFNWRPTYANSIENVFLQVDFFTGMPHGTPGYIIYEDYPPVKQLKFSYQLKRHDHSVWVSNLAPNREYNSEELASFILKLSMDESEKISKSRNY